MNQIANILIIEDDPVITEFLQTGLRYESYQVSVCNTGKEVLPLIRQNSFDLVILDIMLPDIDGFTICRSIRSFDLKVPILIWTVQSSSNLLILLEPKAMCRHSGESRNPEYYQYDMASGCEIKSGMTREL